MTFSHWQAKAIVEIQEEGVQRGFERIVEVLDTKLDGHHGEMRELEARIRIELQTLRADLLKEQRDQMLKFVALVSLIAIVTGAVIKFL